MCPTHRRQADSVISRRLARANVSNPDGWAAITTASLAHQPAAPAQRAGRQAPRADSSIYVIPEPGELAERAAAVVEAAGWFRDRPDDFARLSGRNPSWPASGPTGWRTSSSISAQPAWESQRSGSVTRLARSTPAGRHPSTPTWPSRSPSPASPTKRATGSRPTWPAGRTTCGSASHAGDALVALGDPEGATEHFEAALRMAEESDDFEATAEVIDRLRTATRRSAGEHSGRGGQREQPRRKLSKAQRLRQGRRKPR